MAAPKIYHSTHVLHVVSTHCSIRGVALGHVEQVCLWGEGCPYCMLACSVLGQGRKWGLLPVECRGEGGISYFKCVQNFPLNFQAGVQNILLKKLATIFVLQLLLPSM